MPFEKGKSGNPETMFSSENQPENRGRKGKTTTEFLRELGDAKKIQFSLEITKQDGKKQRKKGSVESESDLNELLANLLWADAIQGNHKARKEILDRVEGRPKQTIDMKTENMNEQQFDLTKLTLDEKIQMLDLLRKSGTIEKV